MNDNTQADMPKSIWGGCETGKTYFYEPFATLYKVIDKGLFPDVLEQYEIDRPINSYHMQDDISHAVILQDIRNNILSAFVVTKTGSI